MTITVNVKDDDEQLQYDISPTDHKGGEGEGTWPSRKVSAY